MSDDSVSNEFLASLLINEEIEQPKQAIDANNVAPGQDSDDAKSANAQGPLG